MRGIEWHLEHADGRRWTDAEIEERYGRHTAFLALDMRGRLVKLQHRLPNRPLGCRDGWAGVDMPDDATVVVSVAAERFIEEEACR